MTPIIAMLVLLAALLHAAWNALLRGGADRLWSMTVMCIAIALACAVLVFFVPAPMRASWAYIIASGLLHVGYNLFLVRTYRQGDLGQTYPIARGSSPLLVAMGALLFAGERLTPLSVAGVALVSAGIFSLAFQGRRLAVAGLPYALGTGCFIGAYSVVDGIGARLSGHAISYTLWMCLIWGLLMPPLYIILRDARSLRRDARQTFMAAAGGIISLIAYGIVVAAMAVAPMGPVSALRETSVVFAALLGRLFLRETLPLRRLAACGIIAAGAVCLSVSSAAALPAPGARPVHSENRRMGAEMPVFSPLIDRKAARWPSWEKS